MSRNEKLVLDYIDEKKKVFINASHQISENPEVSTKEYKASDLLSNLLSENNFKITKNIVNCETGFIAEFDTGKEGPSIAFLAEYDALPEIGHGCGHNIIGTLSSLSAIGLASALAKSDTRVGGKIFVYGTPAEEGGENGCAKAVYANAGLFDNIDAALLLHPGCQSFLTGESLAIISYYISFFGKTAHASSCPEKGINALDALILFFNGIGLLRQQCPKDVRIHGVIKDGGTAPNVIPDYTRADFYLRSATKKGVEDILEKVTKIAEGAATATGCTYKVERYINDVYDTICNTTYDELFREKAKQFGLDYVNDDNIQIGSTDVGNVSHVIPVIQPTLKVCDELLPGHSREFRDACVTQQADEALVLGAKALALTALELIENKAKLDEIKKEHKKLLLEKK